MLFTPDDAKEFVFSFLDQDQLKNAFVNGGLSYSGEREPGTKEAVTVGVINLTDDAGVNNSQLGVVNVNIYASDINKEFNKQFANVPNAARLKALQVIVIELLGAEKGRTWDNGRFNISGISGTLKLTEVKEHYINIRVDIKLYPNN